MNKTFEFLSQLSWMALVHESLGGAGSWEPLRESHPREPSARAIARAPPREPLRESHPVDHFIGHFVEQFVPALRRTKQRKQKAPTNRFHKTDKVHDKVRDSKKTLESVRF